MSNGVVLIPTSAMSLKKKMSHVDERCLMFSNSHTVVLLKSENNS